MRNSSKYFENKDCEYYPCHEELAECNCLFCFCPLYNKENCPGHPSYIDHDGRHIKDCSGCTYPHHPESYDTLIKLI